MFFENKMKSKIGLMISNVVFIFISVFQFISGYSTKDSSPVFQTEPAIITVYITEEVNHPQSSESNNGKININTAPVSELVKLNGIGEVKANAIIQYREKYGPFTSIVQIMKVYGIGDATYDKIKDDICI